MPDTEIMSRVHGTEMEWSVQVPAPDSVNCSRELTSGEFNRYASAYLADKIFIGRVGQAFLERGSRFYADVSEKRETTTPEDTSYLSTTASEIANQQLMFDILCTPIKDFYGNLAPLKNFALNNRAVDDEGNGCGYHESYNVPGNIEIDKTGGLAVLGIHLATRNIYCGAGFMSRRTVDSFTPRFYTAQKATTMFVNFDGATTRNRPVVNTRDEAHSDIRTRRVHVTSGDPHMNPWATRMQLGTTSLVLELMADGLKAQDLNFGPLEHESNGLALFMRRLAQDAAGTSATFKTALAMQKRLQQYAKALNLTEEQLWVVDEWDRVNYELERGDLDHAGVRVEWIARRRMLERQHNGKKGLAWDSDEMRQEDRRWDRIGPDSIGLKLRETAWSEWMPDADLIELRKTTPPTTTRAHLRTRFIRAFHHLNNHPNPSESNTRYVSVDWVHLTCGNRTLTLKDPYATKDEALDRLISAARRPESAD